MITKQERHRGKAWTTVPIAGIAALLLLSGCDEAAAPYRHASDPGIAPPSQEAVQLPDGFDDAALDKAAKVHLAVGRIENELQTKLEQTDDPQLARQLSEEAQYEKTTAMEHAGIDRQTYQEIIRAMNRDAALRSKFLNKMNALQQ